MKFNAAALMCNSSFIGATVFVILAAGVIGCGGGGGSNSTTPTTNSATNGNTNSATNGNTNSATNGNTNSATNGNTNSATNGNTNSSTNGSYTGGNGVLPPNEILFLDLAGQSGTYNIQAINPVVGAQPKALFTNVPLTIMPVAFNPTTKNSYIFGGAASGTALFGIYENASLSLTGATQLVAPSYSQVYSLGISEDLQHIVYTASDSMNVNVGVFVVPTTGGTPTNITTLEGENVAISPDGHTVAYSAESGSNLQIFTYDLTSGKTVQITTAAFDHDYPQFSKDATKLLYCTADANENYHVTIYTLASKSSVDLPNTKGLDEIGPSMNSAGTEISFIGAAAGLYTIPSTGKSNEAELYADPSIYSSGPTYWTTTGGRGISRFGYSVSRLRTRKKP